jgi:hypothetical protein
MGRAYIRPERAALGSRCIHQKKIDRTGPTINFVSSKPKAIAHFLTDGPSWMSPPPGSERKAQEI